MSRRCPFVRQNWRWKQTERTASPSTTMKQPFNRTLPQMPCHRFERRWESCSGMGNKKAFCFNGGRATPYKARLLALYAICLSISRHTAQKSLDIRQYACEISIQSAEKSNYASYAQALCGVALKTERCNKGGSGLFRPCTDTACSEKSRRYLLYHISA